MHGGKRYVLLTIIMLGTCLSGCVSMGRPLPAASSPPTFLARAQDVPLVPIPPPPLSLPEETKPPAPLVIPDNPTPIPPPPSLPEETNPPAPPPITQTSATNEMPAPPPPALVDSPPAPAARTSAVTAKELYETARDHFQNIDSYIVRLIRREVVKGEMNPEEIILFKFRREPWSVYLKWLGKEGQGREALYVKGRYEGKIHSLLAAGDIPFMPAGKRMSLAPDSFLVKSATRHPIYQAGISATIDKIGEIVSATDRGDPRAGSITVVGPVQRSEFDRPAYAIEHVLKGGFDPSMPQGGKRIYFFDPANGLPMLIQAWDERGREVEYYRYDRLQPGVNLDDSDFNPDVIWAKPKDTTVSAAN